jgi:release factor glutamine methyltransferase
VKNNLKDLYNIQRVLEENDYLDSLRIAKEIEEFSQDSDFSIEDILKKIQKDEPWEYIKGEADFLNNKFIVNKDVLIPRIETEQLTLIAKDFLDNNSNYKQVIDVGTGSGCIIIFLAKILCRRNKYKFIGIDKSKRALEVAEKNSVLHNINEKVLFLQKNLLSGVPLNLDTLIIANLPYIPTTLYKKLDKSVKDFEPRRALDGGKDGLKYYKELLKQIERKKGKKKTTLLIEIDYRTLKDLERLLSGKKYTVIKDFRGLKRFLLIHLT